MLQSPSTIWRGSREWGGRLLNAWLCRLAGRSCRLEVVRVLTRLYYAGVLPAGCSAAAWAERRGRSRRCRFRGSDPHRRLKPGAPKTKHILGKDVSGLFFLWRFAPGSRGRFDRLAGPGRRMTALRRSSLDLWPVSPAVMLEKNSSYIFLVTLALPPIHLPRWQNPVRAFAWGMWSVTSTILTWSCLRPISASARSRTTPISASDGPWRARLLSGRPAEIILISTCRLRAAVQAAVTLSAIRLFPMGRIGLAGGALAPNAAN